MKRFLTFALAIVMILSLAAACGNETTTTASTAATTATTAATESGTEQSTDTPDGINLPIVDEPITLTVWQSFNNDIVSDLSENQGIAELARRTNINLDFYLVTSTAASEQFNLLVASQTYYDLMKVVNLNSLGSGDAAVDSEFCIALNDYEQYFPNYLELINSSEKLYRDTRTDSGLMWGFHTILKEPEGAFQGLTYRKDLAEEAGYTGGDPVTIADWEELLTAYRDYGIESPLSIAPTGLFTYDSSFMSAYGVGKDFYIKDGEVTYGYNQEGFKEYLKMMRQWYQDKLIDQQFDTRNTGTSVDTTDAYYLGDDAGAYISIFSYNRNAMYASYRWTDKESYWRQPVPAPVLNEGDELHLGVETTYAGTYPMVISTDNQYPEITCQFLDYLYTDEGFMLINYGIEGVSYTIGEDGKIHASEDITDNPQGFDFSHVKQAYHTWFNVVGLYTYLQSEEDFADPLVYEGYEIWASNTDGAWLYPAKASLTTEESARYTAAFNDINTYVTENVVKFIFGYADIDAEWDNYVKTIEDLGIQECIDIKQASYDRYMAR